MTLFLIVFCLLTISYVYRYNPIVIDLLFLCKIRMQRDIGGIYKIVNTNEYGVYIPMMEVAKASAR